MNSCTVRPEFSELKEFTTSLPETFDEIGRVIYNGRNVIKKVETGRGTLVVKNFRGMYLFNRLAYSFFRQSKAARSYIYSAVLNKYGIKTPPHVGWVDCYKMGLLMKSYFVSVYYPYETLGQAIQHYDVQNPSRKESLLRHLASFARELHRLGVFHEDFSVGNILVIRESERHEFALIDLNRIKFGKVSYARGLRNFATLRTAPEDLNTLIAEYAKLSGQSTQASIDLFWKYQKRKLWLRRLRKNLRRHTITPLEKLFDNTHLL